jgi:hypothetical protein
MAKAEVIRLQTPPFIMAFPKLFKAEPGGKDKTGALKYSVTAIWDPSKFTDADKRRWDAIKAALNDESMRLFKKPFKDLPEATYKKGLRRNNDREEPFDVKRVGDKAIFANLTSSFKPGVIDINKDDIGPEHGNEDLVYPGCIAIAKVNAYAYNQNGGKGVALGLYNVRVLVSDPKKAPRMDNRRSAAEDFDEDVDADWLELYGAGGPEDDEEDMDL